MTKIEMVTEICNRLNEAGFHDESVQGWQVKFAPNCGFGKTLMYLPEFNLESILRDVNKPYKDFQSFYNEIGQSRMWLFKPYIVHNKPYNPCLVLRRDKFLQLATGYGFMLTEQECGYGDSDRNSYNMGFIVNPQYSALKETELWFMLFYACAYQLASRYKDFNMLIWEKPEVFIEFLVQTGRENGLDFEGYSYLEVMKYVKFFRDFETPLHDPLENSKCFEVKLPNGDIIAHLAVNSERIFVETSEHRISLEVPRISPFKKEDLLPEELELEEAFLAAHDKEVYGYLNNHKFLEILTVFALNLVNIHPNYYTVYTTQKLKKLGRFNAPKCSSFSSLNDIYDSLKVEV